MDGIVIHVIIREKHDEKIIEVMRKLEKNNMRANKRKIQFAQNEV